MPQPAPTLALRLGLELQAARSRAELLRPALTAGPERLPASRQATAPFFPRVRAVGFGKLGAFNQGAETPSLDSSARDAWNGRPAARSRALWSSERCRCRYARTSSHARSRSVTGASRFASSSPIW